MKKGDDIVRRQPTHSNLVELARKWLLRRGCSLVLTEIGSWATSEIPDAIGWARTRTLLVECKTTRSDFLADRKKRFRVRPETGAGEERYYLAPHGLLSHKDLPDGWGLVEARGNRLFTKLRAQPMKDRNVRAETAMLLSAIRRIGIKTPTGISVRHYTIRTLNTASITQADLYKLGP